MNKFKLIIPVFLAVLASCSSKENTAENSMEFSYSIDTVMVDSKDHFFFLNWSLGISDLTQDKKLLYNLNPESLLLEVIDMDELALKETVQLEKEGPIA